MADNNTLPATGDVIASKDIGGVKHQRVLLRTPDGVDADATHPYPASPPAFGTVVGFNFTATTTAAKIVTTPQTGRRGVLIQNASGSVAYFGFTSGVTAATGVKLAQLGDTGILPIGPIDIWVISDGTSDIRGFESAL
jgi:hypothetical protein